MSDKEILAALEITSHEVRLLIGEFFNTRLNVLKTERMEIKGVDGWTIKDAKEVSQAIRKVVSHASDMLGVRIERVLLCIPSYRMHKESQRISKMIDHYERKVMLDDIQSMVKQGLATAIDPDAALVNLVCTRYITNGISSRRMPVDEVCDVLDIDMDLLCADKMTTYDYVKLVEMAGLEIIDICLDVYAAAKETAMFEQTMMQHAVIVQLERDRTTLAIVSGGKIEVAKMMAQGYQQWIAALMEAHGIDEACARKVLLQNTDLTKVLPSASPIFMWAKERTVYTVTEKGAYDTLIGCLNRFADDIRTTCEPILQTGKVKFVLCGEGSEVDGLDVFMANRLGCDVKTYQPDTIGARNGLWTVCLGMIYAYHDQQMLYRNRRISIDQAEFAKAVKIRKQEEPDDRFTQRLRGLIFPDKSNR